MKKKLAIVYPCHYEQGTGGAELQISYIVKYWKDIFDIHFIYIDFGVPIKNTDKINLHPLKNRFIIKRRLYAPYEYEITKVLDDINPHYIYTRSTSSWIYIAEKYAQKHSIKHIHAFASDKCTDMHLFRGNKSLIGCIEAFYINKGLKLGERFIFQNSYQRDMMKSRFGKEGILVRQMTPYVDMSDKNKLEAKDKIRIVWIANLKPIKRPELFLELAHLLKEYATKIEMRMIGIPNTLYEDTVRSTEKECTYFKFVGFLKQEEVFELLEKSDILVNTSEYEGFSNTYVQAWMRKCIVLATNSNPDNIITDKQIGYINPDIAQLAKQIEGLIDDRKKMSEMQERAYRYAAANHSIENNIKAIYDYLVH